MKSGKIIVAGPSKAGKTSILNRIRNLQFNPGVKPTLGVQSFKFIMNEVDFFIFDLPGQEKLRESWYNKSLEPNGIIYVIDCSLPVSEQSRQRAEFDKLTAFFVKKEKPAALPLLIFGNKIDIVQDYKGILQNMFWDIGQFNFQLAYCSAKNNEGIKENFAWLVGEMIRINLEE